MIANNILNFIYKPPSDYVLILLQLLFFVNKTYNFRNLINQNCRMSLKKVFIIFEDMI